MGELSLLDAHKMTVSNYYGQGERGVSRLYLGLHMVGGTGMIYTYTELPSCGRLNLPMPILASGKLIFSLEYMEMAYS